MKKATNLELRKIIKSNKEMICSFNHVEISNPKLRQALLLMPDCTLHYNIVGNCIFIFKPETK